MASVSDEKEDRALHGLTRTLINNMVIGVTAGYVKKLEINGVGYRVAMQGKSLNITLGYSHPVIVDAPEGITFDIETGTLTISKDLLEDAESITIAAEGVKKEDEDLDEEQDSLKPTPETMDCPF